MDNKQHTILLQQCHDCLAYAILSSVIMMVHGAVCFLRCISGAMIQQAMTMVIEDNSSSSWERSKAEKEDNIPEWCDGWWTMGGTGHSSSELCMLLIGGWLEPTRSHDEMQHEDNRMMKWCIFCYYLVSSRCTAPELPSAMIVDMVWCSSNAWGSCMAMI